MPDPQRTLRLPVATWRQVEGEAERQALTVNGWFRRWLAAALAASLQAAPASRKRKRSRALP